MLDDANLRAAAEAARVGSFLGAGQSCSAAERILVHEAVRDEFVSLLAGEVEREVRLGDPLDDATTMGPVNNEPGALKMDAHVADAVERGATVVTGGSRAAGFPTELYWQPTILNDVPPRDSIAVTQETFGPIAPMWASGRSRRRSSRPTSDLRADGRDLHERPRGRPRYATRCRWAS